MKATRWGRIGVGATAVLACVALAGSSSTENSASKVGGNGPVTAPTTVAGSGTGAAGATPDAAAGQPTTAPGDAPAPSTTASGPTTFAVGDEVQLGDWTVMVATVTDPWVSPNSFDKPKGRYVALDTTVRNRSTSPQTVSSIMCFELRDATGRSYNQSLVIGNDAKAPDGEVDPNGLLRGTLTFDVPADATGLTLRFKCDLFSSGSATIALG